MLLYYDDVESCGGATACVEREGPDDPAYHHHALAGDDDREQGQQESTIANMPGVGKVGWINDREIAEAYLRENCAPECAVFRQELYRREKLVRYQRGAALFYRHDVWHRGTPLLPGVCRRVHNFVLRKRECEWITHWSRGWAPSLYTWTNNNHQASDFATLLATCSVEQRTVLGFPQPGHPYWTPYTLQAVKQRYGPLGFDVGPYQQAVTLAASAPSTPSTVRSDSSSSTALLLRCQVAALERKVLDLEVQLSAAASKL